MAPHHTPHHPTQPTPTQPSPTQPHPTQPNPTHLNSTQPNPAQPNPTQPNTPQRPDRFSQHTTSTLRFHPTPQRLDRFSTPPHPIPPHRCCLGSGSHGALHILRPTWLPLCLPCRTHTTCSTTKRKAIALAFGKTWCSSASQSTSKGSVAGSSLSQTSSTPASTTPNSRMYIEQWAPGDGVSSG